MDIGRFVLLGLLTVILLVVAVGPVAACSGSLSHDEVTDDERGTLAPQCPVNMRKEGVPAGGGMDLGLAVTTLALISITGLLMRIK